MSMETALVAIKTANTALNALVGTRFHPDVFPQEVVMPAVRFTQISKVEPDFCFAGRPQVSIIRVQMDAIAEDRAGREELRGALMNCFLPDPRVSGSYGGEYLFDIRTNNGFSTVDQLDAESEAYRSTIDFICDFRWSAAL